MKKKLVNGIALVALALFGSCSATSQLARKESAFNDDVYYSRAKAGDQFNYFAGSSDQPYTGDDDYYYYGDYASRLSRFANYSPFDYSDNFYYNYVPYNNGFGDGLAYNPDYYYGYGQPNNLTTVNSPYIYSPYDYGYSPFDMGGYDDFGYGDLYIAGLFGGGGGYYSYGGSYTRRHTTGSTTVASIGYNPNVRGIRTTQSPGVTRIAAYYPGNPTLNLNAGMARNLTTVNGNNTVSRPTRDNNYRPIQQNNTPPPTYSAPSSGSTSSGTSNSGGGGRPVRP
jgi:hypothetical protein